MHEFITNDLHAIQLKCLHYFGHGPCTSKVMFLACHICVCQMHAHAACILYREATPMVHQEHRHKNEVLDTLSCLF